MSAIRRGQPGDAEALAELGARAFSDTFLADNDPADIAAFLANTFAPEKQAVELADSAVDYLVAEDRSALAGAGSGGLLVGYAMLQRGPAPACVAASAPIEIARLYVARAQLGRGAGEALMARCVEDARNAGHDVIWLGVWERNARAIRFYERWSFRRVGEHVFVVGSDPQTDLLFRRSL
jgi:ribosomal protein S18 acetylase RimI-like enzyme